MSYYQGDFYPRPMGDPGIGSFLGGLVKKAAGFIPGIGPMISAAIPAARSSVVKQSAGVMTRGVQAVRGAIVKHPVLSAAGAAGVVGMTAGAVGGRMLGHHGGSGKKHRRMNPCNPRALRRAIRRAHSFAKHYRKVVGFVSPHKPKGRMYFKKKKRAA